MAAQLNENTQYKDESTGELLNNGYIYIGLDGQDAKINPATIYSDRNLSVALDNPQRIGSDGRALNKIWVSGKYSMKVENSANVQKLNDLSLGDDEVTSNTVLNNIQGTDAITADGSPTITDLVANQVYIFTAANTNTTAMTLTIDLVTTYPIKKQHDKDMVAGDIEANQVVAVIWNATDSVFELMTNSALEPVDVATNQTVAGNKNFTGDTTLAGTNTLSGATTLSGPTTNITGVTTLSGVIAGASPLVFEGATENDFETTLAITDPTADRTLTVQDKSGTLSLIVNNSGHISGLALSNDTDTDHDINITAGYANDSGNTVSMNLSAEITKQIDATWAVGDDAGGLFTGTVAIDTWYHVFLIQKDSDGSIDAGFDTSVTAANIPAGYTAYHLINSVLTDGSANILGTFQAGDRTYLKTPLNDFNTTLSTGSRALTTMSTPLGRRVIGLFTGSTTTAALETVSMYISSPDGDDIAATSFNAQILASNNSGFSGAGTCQVVTNTSSQVGIRGDIARAGKLTTLGWITPRG